MLRQKSGLVTLVQRLEAWPWPSAPAQRARGRPQTAAERLLVKALVIMMTRRLATAYAWLPFRTQAELAAQQRRPLVPAHGRLPTRRTWERRLAALPPPLPGLLGGCGRHLVPGLSPWGSHGRAAAIESTPWPTGGGVWPTTPTAPGARPQTALAPAAGGAKAGGPGGWSGGTRPLAVSVGAVGLPRAAALTPANPADHAGAPRLLTPLPAAGRSVRGDPAYHAPAGRRRCEPTPRAVVATRRGAYPQPDAGVAVRRLCHPLRSQAMAPCHGLGPHVCAWRTQRPVTGLRRSPRWALGAIVMYQAVWRDQHAHYRPLGTGLQPLVRAA
jgi:hypothetical protein